MSRYEWNQQGALFLCRALERIAPEFGAHVALTGGCLYKDGKRKDVDILLYRIRQVDRIDVDGFFGAIREKMGVKRGDQFGWVIKATWCDMNIDFFFPEPQGDEFDYFANARDHNGSYGGVL